MRKTRLTAILIALVLAISFFSFAIGENPAYAAVTHTVTFNAFGGTVSPSYFTYNDGEYFLSKTLPTPTKSGYTFSHWSLEEGGDPIQSFHSVLQDWTIYAVWGYTLTFNSQGGSDVPPQVVIPIEIIDEPPQPTRPGYTFVGWFSGSTQINFPYTYNYNGDRTFYAHWELNPETYKVSFGSQGGSSVPSQTVTYGTSINAPTPPTLSGYTFVGWFTNTIGGTKINFPYTVTENVTFYAQWEADVPDYYTVTFNSQGGSAVSSQTVDPGTSINAPTPPTKTDYTFLGWFTSSTGGTQVSFPYVVNSNKTFYAHWQLNEGVTQYTVDLYYWHPSNGEGPSGLKHSTLNVNAGSTFAFPSTVPDVEQFNVFGYTFVGWSKLSPYAVVSTPAPVTADISYYAVFVPNYTIIFNSQGGTSVPAQTVAKGTSINPPLPPIKEGYYFLGWSKNASGGGVLITFPYTVTENDNFYAIWQENTESYSIYFNSQGGSTVYPRSVEAGSSIDAPEEPIKTGYSFDGWYTAATGGEKITFPYTPTGDIDLYAHWIATSTYTVTFNSQGGSSVPSQTVNPGTSINAPTPPTKTGYTFLGWFTAATGGTQVSFPYVVNSNKIFYAHWQSEAPGSYTITWDPNGGSFTE